MNRPRYQEQLTFNRESSVECSSVSRTTQTIESLCIGTTKLWQPQLTLSPPPPMESSSVINNTCKDNGDTTTTTTTQQPHHHQQNNCCCRHRRRKRMAAMVLPPCKNDCDIAKCRRVAVAAPLELICRLIKLLNKKCIDSASVAESAKKLYQNSDFSSEFASKSASDDTATNYDKRRKSRISFSSASSSVKTIFGQCLMICIFLLYLSVYSCSAARQEGKCSFLSN